MCWSIANLSNLASLCYQKVAYSDIDIAHNYSRGAKQQSLNDSLLLTKECTKKNPDFNLFRMVNPPPHLGHVSCTFRNYRALLSYDEILFSQSAHAFVSPHVKICTTLNVTKKLLFLFGSH